MNMVPQLAKNGRIALEMFDPGAFDLVLMDVAMPEMDGLEATRRIRMKWGDVSMPPILALTAHVMEAVEEEAALVGITTILSKPIPFEELKAALQHALADAGSNAIADIAVPEAVSPSANPADVLSKMAPATLTELLSIVSEEMLLDLVQEYVTDASERMQQIIGAVADNDINIIKEQAHSIKGSSLVLGFSTISDCARTLEQNSREGQITPHAIDQINSELAELASFLA